MGYWLENSGTLPLEVFISNGGGPDKLDPDERDSYIWNDEAAARFDKIFPILFAERWRWGKVKLQNFDFILATMVYQRKENHKTGILFPQLHEISYDGLLPFFKISHYANQLIRKIVIQNTMLNIQDWSNFVICTPHVEELELRLVRWKGDLRVGMFDCGHGRLKAIKFETGVYCRNISHCSLVLASTLRKSRGLDTVELSDSGGWSSEDQASNLFQMLGCEGLSPIMSVRTFRINLLNPNPTNLHCYINDLDYLVEIFPNVEHFTFSSDEVFDGRSMSSDREHTMGKFNKRLLSAVMQLSKLKTAQLVNTPVHADTFIECLRDLQTGTQDVTVPREHLTDLYLGLGTRKLPSFTFSGSNLRIVQQHTDESAMKDNE
jgi:hypothetical protein